MDPTTAALILQLVQLLSYGLQHAPEIAGEVREIAETLSGAAAGVPVTPEQLADLRARMDRAHHALSVL